MRATPERCRFHEAYASLPFVRKGHSVLGRFLLPFDRLEWELFEKHLGEVAGKRILDLGCGYGLRPLTFALLGAEAIGIESDPKLVDFSRFNEARAREALGERGKDLRIAFHLGDATRDLGRWLPDGPADIVYVNHVIEHLPDPEGFVAVCREALAPGGTLFLGCPNDPAFAPDPGEKVWGEKEHGHLHGFTPESLAALVGRLGFEVQASFAFPPFPLWQRHVRQHHGWTAAEGRLRYFWFYKPGRFRLASVYHAATAPAVGAWNRWIYPRLLESYRRELAALTTNGSPGALNFVFARRR